MSARVCKIEDCGKRLVARGLCTGHYQAAKKAGTLVDHETVALPATSHCLWCRTPIAPSSRHKRHCDQVCTQRAAAHRQLCTTWPTCGHERPRVGKAHKPLVERLLNKIDQSGGPDACWLWMGHRSERGYGHTSYWNGERQVGLSSHRAMYAQGRKSRTWRTADTPERATPPGPRALPEST